MKTKLLVLLLIIIIISPFLIYRFNKDLSKKYLEYYFNTQFSKLSEGAKVTFSDFSLKNNGKFSRLVVKDISVTSKGAKIAEVNELRFYFNWGFLYTKVKPIKAVINHAIINLPIEAKESKNKTEDLLAATKLLNTEIIVENIQFNDYLIKDGFIRMNKRGKRDILNVKINEADKSEIEIEVAQSNLDKITVSFHSFNPGKSVFYELIKNRLVSANIDAILDGYFILDVNENSIQGVINNISGSFSIREDFPLNIERGSFSFGVTQNSWRLSNADINVDNFAFSGEIHHKDGIQLNGRVEGIKHQEILKYWGLQSHSEAREWYEKNIKSVSVKSAEIALEEGNFSIRNLYFEDGLCYISEEDVRLDVQNAYGDLELIGNKLVVHLKSGTLYKTNVADAYISAEKEAEDLKVTVKGGIDDGVQNLLLIANNTVGDQIKTINKAINLDNVTGGDGIMSLMLEIYPKAKKVKKKIYGRFRDIKLHNLYNAFEVQDADLALEVTDELFKLSGFAIANGNRMNLDIQNDYGDFTYFKLNGECNVDNLKNAKFIPDLSFIGGSVFGNLAIKVSKDEKLEIEGSGDLNNIEINKAFGWNNDGKGRFSFKASKKGDDFQLKNLQISGNEIDIHAAGKINGESADILFDRMRINDSHARLNYISNKGQQKIYIESKFLDLSKFEDVDTFFSNKGDNQNYNISAKLREVKLKDEILLLDTEIQLGSVSGSLTGIFNDNSILTITYDKSIGIDLNTTNCGTLLRALGINNSVVGGRASVHLDTKDIRYNKGTLRLENFFVKNAPTLAQILSLASLWGITDILNGDGIYFYRFLAPFKYGDGVIEFDESWIEGNALGISAGGIISIPENGAVINGELVPLYRLNQIIWRIPFIGKIVTGGGNSRSVIAAEYTMTKNQKKTSVYVNPLAAFTPNVLKKFLRFFG